MELLLWCCGLLPGCGLRGLVGLCLLLRLLDRKDPSYKS